MKDIQGFEGLYAITRDGKVWSHQNKRFLKYRNFEKRYPTACLHIGGKAAYRYIHRLVALTYLPNPHRKKCVHHKNAIRTDNRVENLEWCTVQENTQHTKKMGNSTYGARNPMSKLTAEDVLSIRRLWQEADLSKVEIAKKYGVTASNVYVIVTRKTWDFI